MDALPVEIVVNVFDHLAHSISGGHSYLAACALVSRRWKTLVTPILWRSVDIVWTAPRPALSFISAIRTSADLRTLPTSLRVIYPDYENIMDKIRLDAVPGLAAQQMFAKAKADGSYEAHEYYRFCSDRPQELESKTKMLCLAHLDEIGAGLWADCDDRFDVGDPTSRADGLRQLFRILPLLTSLRRLHLSDVTLSGFTPSRPYLQHSLDTIRELVIDNPLDQRSENEYETPSIIKHCPNLAVLDLRDEITSIPLTQLDAPLQHLCEIRASHFEDALQRWLDMHAASLRKVVIENCHSEGQSHCDVLDALSPCRGLEEICLHPNISLGRFASNDDLERRHFSPFASLRRLVMGQTRRNAIIDIIPPQLESLTIQYITPTYPDSPLEALPLTEQLALAERATGFKTRHDANLRTFEIRERRRWPSGQRHRVTRRTIAECEVLAYEELRDQARAVGLELALRDFAQVDEEVFWYPEERSYISQPFLGLEDF